MQSTVSTATRVSGEVAAAASRALAPVEAARLQQQAELEVTAASIPPWQTLAEQYSILEDELRERILRVSTDESCFDSTKAGLRRRDGNILPACLPMAKAALEADLNLSQLRYRLVPARMTDENFWRW